MRLMDWPAAERPREKLLARGPESLTDAELLAIFLRTGVSGKNAVELAGELLTSFGGLRALLTADKTEYCARPGLGEASFVQLQAVLEMAKRHMVETLKREDAFTQPEQVKRYLVAKLRDCRRELFLCLFLDNQHRLIASEVLFEGTINASAVYPREVVLRALAHNAAALILAHNHPSGSVEPSAADISMTKRLKDALSLIEVRVLDHIIVGDGATYAMSEHGQC